LDSETKFEARQGTILGLRSGTINASGKHVPTPLFFPIVNILTGPPPVFANGGIWKHIKSQLFKEERIPAFMTHILHFTDYSVDRNALERWFKTTIPDQILEQAGYTPALFVDSGGYRLLYNTGLDIEKYGYEPSVRDILQLQARFGGDVVASLDYPIHPKLRDVEVTERIEKTIENCLETARLSKQILGANYLLHLAVHGLTRVQARGTVEHLLSRLRSERLDRIPFGIAIGSLVPLASSPLQVVEIVRGVVEGIHSCNWVDPLTIPVHAFGVSSRMMPFLAALGVDSFDGTTYVQYAQSLKYLKPGGFSPVPFAKLDHIDCRCRYCTKLREGGLETAKEILVGRSFGKVRFAEAETTKSYVYALIALHNLQSSLEMAGRIRKAAVSPSGLEDLFVEAARDPRMRRILGSLLRYFPDASEFLWDFGFSKLEQRLRVDAKPGLSIPASSKRTDSGLSPLDLAKQSTDIISLNLGPEAFDVCDTGYRLAKKPLLLVLPCSQQKPYSSSPSHRLIKKTVLELGIDASIYNKISISGNYGPVPEEFETDPRVQSYDFYLSSGDTRRIKLLVDRTRRFLAKQSGQLVWIVGYVTLKSYREVLERALDGLPNAFLLPERLRARRASEFRKPENIQQLRQVLLRLKERGFQ